MSEAEALLGLALGALVFVCSIRRTEDGPDSAADRFWLWRFRREIRGDRIERSTEKGQDDG